MKKKKLQDELERVERMLADAYDRCVYVCMCVVCACVLCVHVCMCMCVVCV